MRTIHGQQYAGIFLDRDMLMDARPTYEELQQRIKELEKETAELKQVKEALRQSKEQYQHLVEDINEVVYCLDMNAVVTYISPNIESASGYSPAEVIGRNFIEFVYPEDLEGRMTQFQRILAGTNEATEYRFITKTNKIVWVRTAARPIVRDGRLIGIQGILMDLTERKIAEERKMELEAQLQNARKMEALGILAGGVAHDLNNVLGGIVGFPDLLLSQLEDDSQLRKPLESILKSGEKAAAIVQDLLTLARRGVKTYDVVNLNQIIRDHFDSLEYEQLRFYHPKVGFTVQLDDDLLEIKGSAVHLSKTIMNLLSNAAEAMPAGGNVTISTTNRYIDRPIQGYDEVKQGDYVVLRVSDEGPGMSAEDMERIFEPFYTKKMMGRSGTGLGMAVVWGTVKDHHGYIDIENSQGSGATFSLYFPVTREIAKKGSQRISIERCSGKGENIVVVDDVAEQRELAALMLGRLGYDVITLASGEEAVEYMKDHVADLVVLDMIMDPGIDGLETFQRILEIHPAQKAIIVSGFSETDRIKQARELGAGAYVMKPYRMEKIGLAVRTELDKR